MDTTESVSYQNAVFSARAEAQYRGDKATWASAFAAAKLRATFQVGH
jgi:hypothetical protein